MKKTKAIARTSILAVPFALGAGMAMAGGTTDDVAAPAPITATQAAGYSNMGSDWTGFYAGGQLGYGKLDPNTATVPSKPDGASFGVHAGYNYDLGNVVVGGEVDFDQADISTTTPQLKLDSVARLKARLGYDAGQYMPYLTAGVAEAKTTGAFNGTTQGGFAGLGVAYKVSDTMTVGGEILQHQFKDVAGNAGVNIDATTMSVRASFNF